MISVHLQQPYLLAGVIMQAAMVCSGWKQWQTARRYATLNHITVNFIAKLRTFIEDSRKSRANTTRLKAVSGVCSTFTVQNHNPQQEKALSEFISRSDVFVNLPMHMESPFYIRWLHLWRMNFQSSNSHFLNKSTAVCKIYLKKKV